MTYREWFTATARRFGIEGAEVELIMANQTELIPNPEDTVEPKTAKTALVKEFASIIPLANVSEGGYSVTWNMEAVKLWYNQTCDELGITPADKPKVRDRSNVW